MPNGIEDVLGVGLIAAEQIAEEVRDRLIFEVTGAFGQTSIGEVVQIAREVLEATYPILAQALADVEIAAWVVGFNELAEFVTDADLIAAGIRDPIEALRDPDIVDLFTGFHAITGPFTGPVAGRTGSIITPAPSIRFPVVEDAAENLIQSRAVRRDVFDTLSEQAKSHAFTVAHINSVEVIDRIRDAVVDSVSTGSTKREFEKTLRDQIGVSHLSPQHVESVFRTNVLGGYSVGKEQAMQHPVVSSVFPYAQYYATHDTRVREDHLEMESRGPFEANRSIYRADDPCWLYRTPPWSYNCRCVKRMMTLRQAAQAGIEEARRWMRTGQPPLRPMYAEGDFPSDGNFVPRATGLMSGRLAI